MPQPIIHQQTPPSLPPAPVPTQPQLNATPTKPIIQQPMQTPIKTEPLPVKTEDDIDVNWLYVCDWRGCQR